MKYIPTDKLIAEIDRQEIGYNTDGKHAAEYDTCRKILDIITSLQQEQPEVDLKEEFHRWLSKEKEEWGGEIPPYGDYGLFGIALHFYELGLNTRKEE